MDWEPDEELVEEIEGYISQIEELKAVYSSTIQSAEEMSSEIKLLISIVEEFSELSHGDYDHLGVPEFSPAF